LERVERRLFVRFSVYDAEETATVSNTAVHETELQDEEKEEEKEKEKETEKEKEKEKKKEGGGRRMNLLCTISIFQQQSSSMATSSQNSVMATHRYQQQY